MDMKDLNGLTIDELAEVFLKERRGRYVINKTGLAGKFDIHLESEIGAEVRQRVDPSSDLFGPSTAPPLPAPEQPRPGRPVEPHHRVRLGPQSR